MGLLISEEDLKFRNLGGTATQFLPVTPDVGTLTVRVRMTRTYTSAGMMIQFYDFAVYAGTKKVYVGDTYFGFFPVAALQRQEGLKDAAPYAPTAMELERGRALVLSINAHGTYIDQTKKYAKVNGKIMCIKMIMAINFTTKC